MKDGTALFSVFVGILFILQVGLLVDALRNQAVEQDELDKLIDRVLEKHGDHKWR